MQNIVIRQAKECDAESIGKITQEAFENYARFTGAKNLGALLETKEDILCDIANKLVFVAEADGKAVGCVRVSVNGDNAYLSRFAVSEAYRENGVGTKLIEAVDCEMQKKGVKKISLHSASKMFALIRFYYGKGFYIESTDMTPGYIRAKLTKDYDK